MFVSGFLVVFRVVGQMLVAPIGKFLFVLVLDEGRFVKILTGFFVFSLRFFMM